MAKGSQVTANKRQRGTAWLLLLRCLHHICSAVAGSMLQQLLCSALTGAFHRPTNSLRPERPHSLVQLSRAGCVVMLASGRAPDGRRHLISTCTRWTTLLCSHLYGAL